LDKDGWRERIWTQLECSGVSVFPGARGRVPNFHGAVRAADHLAETDAWRAAFVIKVNLDAAQKPVRLRALRSGKILIVPLPRLAEARCFYRIDPDRIPRKDLNRAATLRGAATFGTLIGPKDVPLLDMLVVGSVAVNAMGQRVGRGDGYSDLEYALGREHGFVLEETVIATTVHGIQVVNDPLPVTPHDFDLDIILTPDEIIRTIRSRPRPGGIIWDHLTAEKLQAIPALGRLRRGRGPLR
jgi:5-formyltetrahydrofolate cyclo-ligase